MQIRVNGNNYNYVRVHVYEYELLLSTCVLQSFSKVINIYPSLGMRLLLSKSV